jgi:hypothetical protein
LEKLDKITNAQFLSKKRWGRGKDLEKAGAKSSTILAVEGSQAARQL